MRRAFLLAPAILLAALAAVSEAQEKSLAEQAAADWLYPGAKVTSSGNSGDLSQVVQESADDVSKVLKHYADKAKAKFGVAGSSSGSGEAPGLGMVQYTHAVLKPEKVGGAGSVSTFQTKAAVVTVVVARPKDGTVTMVVVSHVPLAAKRVES